MKENKLILLLKIFSISVFIGRAWEHLRWNPPFRALLWDQKLMEGAVQKLFGLSWQEYATSMAVDAKIQLLIHGFGWFYVLCAIASLLINKKTMWLKYILFAGSLALTFLAFLYSKEKFFQVGQFLEYACPIAAPIFLIYAIKGKITERFMLYLKIIIAITFCAHGLYAVGYYPIPGEWVDMFINTFGIEQNLSYTLLKIAGVLDIIMSLLLFYNKTTKAAFIYLMAWGIITALARLVANYHPDFILQWMEQYLHTAIYRIPNFGLPLIGWLLMRQKTLPSRHI